MSNKFFEDKWNEERKKVLETIRSFGAMCIQELKHIPFTEGSSESFVKLVVNLEKFVADEIYNWINSFAEKRFEESEELKIATDKLKAKAQELEMANDTNRTRLKAELFTEIEEFKTKFPGWGVKSIGLHDA